MELSSDLSQEPTISEHHMRRFSDHREMGERRDDRLPTTDMKIHRQHQYYEVNQYTSPSKTVFVARRQDEEDKPLSVHDRRFDTLSLDSIIITTTVGPIDAIQGYITQADVILCFFLAPADEMAFPRSTTPCPPPAPVDIPDNKNDEDANSNITSPRTARL